MGNSASDPRTSAEQEDSIYGGSTTTTTTPRGASKRFSHPLPVKDPQSSASSPFACVLGRGCSPAPRGCGAAPPRADQSLSVARPSPSSPWWRPSPRSTLSAPWPDHHHHHNNNTPQLPKGPSSAGRYADISDMTAVMEEPLFQAFMHSSSRRRDSAASSPSSSSSSSSAVAKAKQRAIADDPPYSPASSAVVVSDLSDEQRKFRASRAASSYWTTGCACGAEPSAAAARNIAFALLGGGEGGFGGGGKTLSFSSDGSEAGAGGGRGGRGVHQSLCIPLACLCERMRRDERITKMLGLPAELFHHEANAAVAVQTLAGVLELLPPPSLRAQSTNNQADLGGDGRDGGTGGGRGGGSGGDGVSNRGAWLVSRDAFEVYFGSCPFGKITMPPVPVGAECPVAVPWGTAEDAALVKAVFATDEALGISSEASSSEAGGGEKAVATAAAAAARNNRQGSPNSTRAEEKQAVLNAKWASVRTKKNAMCGPPRSKKEVRARYKTIAAAFSRARRKSRRDKGQGGGQGSGEGGGGPPAPPTLLAARVSGMQ